jgi:hypothetical protein
MKTLLALYPPVTLALAGALGAYLFVPLILVAIFGIADTFGRYKDYLYLSRFGYLTPRLADFYGRSRCGRSVVIAVGGGSYREYYKEKGYKFWHFLPKDFPMVLFNRRFWCSLVRGHSAI